MKAVCLIFSMLIAAVAAAQDVKALPPGVEEPVRWRPCQAVWFSWMPDLDLSSRIRRQLGIDRPGDTDDGRELFRFVIEPSESARFTPPREGESTVAVYLPEREEAIVELAIAKRSIRTMNSQQREVNGACIDDVTDQPQAVPVSFTRTLIDRTLALWLEKRVLQEMEKKPPEVNWIVVYMDAATSYTVRSDKICVTGDGDFNGKTFALTWLGRAEAVL